MRTLPVFALLCALPVAAQPLADAVRGRIGDFPGTVSLYAKNLDTGATFGIREAEPVRTASTIKLAILCSVFDQVARGQAKFTDPLAVTAAEQVSGSGITLASALTREHYSGSPIVGDVPTPGAPNQYKRPQ